MNARSLTDKSVSSTILVLVIFLAACATPPPGIEPPKISIANIAPKDMTLFEQRFESSSESRIRMRRSWA